MSTEPPAAGFAWPSGPLLLLLDFDGTLVPIAPTPDSIEVPAELPGILRALEAKGHLVWIVTGRPSEFVRGRLGDFPVVGLHGLDWPGEEMPPRDPALDEAKRALAHLTDKGVLLEDKGRSFAFHVRPVRADKAAVEDEIAATLARFAGEALTVLHGHEVYELRPRAASKANAALRLRAAHPGRALVYLGDDVTDEEAMAALEDAADEGRALTVRVGPGETRARARLPDPAAVLAALRALSA